MLATLHVTPVAGTTIAWTELGQGQPLVLLHGIGDSHRTWRDAAPLLAQHYRVILPDLPGHGLSGRPDAPYTLDWYADVLLAWLRQIDIPHAHLAGHSFGGGIAQWMLLSAPSRVDTLTLVAAGGLGREVALGVRLAAFPVLGELLTQAFMGVGTFAMLSQARGRSLRSDWQEMARAIWLNHAPGTGRAFQRSVVGCMNLRGQHVQTWSHIHEVPNLPPTLVFWGEEDRILPVKHCRQAVARLRGARVVIYERCGHLPHLERAEQFSGDLARFLDDPPPSPVLLGSP